MVDLTSQAALAIKAQSAPGTYATPTSSDATMVANLSWTPQAITSESPEYTGSIHRAGQIVLGATYDVSFDILIRGPGGASPPAADAFIFGRVMRALGFTENIISSAIPAAAEALGGGSTTTVGDARRFGRGDGRPLPGPRPPPRRRWRHADQPVHDPGLFGGKGRHARRDPLRRSDRQLPDPEAARLYLCRDGDAAGAQPQPLAGQPPLQLHRHGAVERAAHLPDHLARRRQRLPAPDLHLQRRPQLLYRRGLAVGLADLGHPPLQGRQALRRRGVDGRFLAQRRSRPARRLPAEPEQGIGQRSRRSWSRPGAACR
jgi:hypothetical protein